MIGINTTPRIWAITLPLTSLKTLDMNSDKESSDLSYTLFYVLYTIKGLGNMR